MPRPGAQLLPRTPGARRAGFTLIEILLVLAVVALVSALLMPGLGGIFRTLDNQAPDQVLWDAVTAARERALSANRTVWLRFDKEQPALTWTDDLVTQTKAWPADASLQLLPAREGAAAFVLVGGQLLDTQEIPGVRFYPDGTCDRFRAQIRTGTAAPRIFAVDPWTCARVINAEAQP
jgi:prepilin-type N-terminal cleavage/methylation domain-containing protein